MKRFNEIRRQRIEGQRPYPDVKALKAYRAENTRYRAALEYQRQQKELQKASTELGAATQKFEQHLVERVRDRRQELLNRAEEGHDQMHGAFDNIEAFLVERQFKICKSFNEYKGAFNKYIQTFNETKAYDLDDHIFNRIQYDRQYKKIENSFNTEQEEFSRVREELENMRKAYDNLHNAVVDFLKSDSIKKVGEEFNRLSQQLREQTILPGQAIAQAERVVEKGYTDLQGDFDMFKQAFDETKQVFDDAQTTLPKPCQKSLDDVAQAFGEDTKFLVERQAGLERDRDHINRNHTIFPRITFLA